MATPSATTGGDSRNTATVRTPGRRTGVIVAAAMLAVAAAVAFMMKRPVDGASRDASQTVKGAATTAGAAALGGAAGFVANLKTIITGWVMTGSDVDCTASLFINC